MEIEYIPKQNSPNQYYFVLDFSVHSKIMRNYINKRTNDLFMIYIDDSKLNFYRIVCEFCSHLVSHYFYLMPDNDKL